MKKVFSAAGILVAAFILLSVPVSAQTPGDITATITAAPSAPPPGSNVIVSAAFTSPNPSAAASVSISYTGGGAPSLVSFTAGLSSCVTASTSVTCTWTTPAPNVSPQTLVIEVPVSGGTVIFNANAGAIGGTLASKAQASVTVGQATTTTVAGTTTTVAATTTVAPPPTEAATTVAPTTTAAGTLPATGSSTQAPLFVAIAAIALGALLVGGTRLLRSRS